MGNHGPVAAADEALSVWRAARVAEGKTPDRDRIERVRVKLADAEARLVVAERDGRVVGVVLAEPFREDDGAGRRVFGRGHVTMVFVHPDFQGRGVGRELMELAIAELPWPCLSLWTRDGNTRAQRLYAAVGFVPTMDSGRTPHGDRITRWQLGPAPEANHPT